jgi:hypothetical protein
VERAGGLAANGGAEDSVALLLEGAAQDVQRRRLARPGHADDHVESPAGGGDGLSRPALSVRELAAQRQLLGRNGSPHRLRSDRCSGCALRQAGCDRLHGLLGREHRGRSPRSAPGSGLADERNRLGMLEDASDDTIQLLGLEAIEGRGGSANDVSPRERLAFGQWTAGADQLADAFGSLVLRQEAERLVLAVLDDAEALVHPPGRPADLVQLVEPPHEQGLGRLFDLRVSTVSSGDPSGPVGRESDRFELLLDFRRALGEQLGDRRGDPGDGPVVELPGRPAVRLDGVAELDGLLGGGESARHRRCVDDVPDAGGVESLPSASVVKHLCDIGDQHVVVRSRVAGTRRCVTGAGPQQAARRCAPLGLAPPASLAREPLVEECQGGVALRVEDGVHVVDPADEPEHSDGLVGGDDQLDTGPLARREHRPEMRVACAARAEDRLVAGVVHGAREAEPFSEAASPLERRLAAAAVVGQSAALEVVVPSENRPPVVFDRVDPHHPEPRHGTLPRDATRRGCKRVLAVLGYGEGNGAGRGDRGGRLLVGGDGAGVGVPVTCGAVESVAGTDGVPGRR